MICTRSFVLSFVSITLYVFIAFAAPSNSAPTTRDVINASMPILNAFASIRDRNGIDVSSSFKVKVYRHTLSAGNSTISEENSLNDRQVRTDVVRMIDQCHGNETFIESHCTPNDEEEGSLQAFVYTCKKAVQHWRESTGEFIGMAPAHRTRSGHCEPSELCVDGFAPKQIASCVHTSLFDDFMIDKDGRLNGMLFGEVFDVAKAFAILSKNDQSTPKETGSLSIAAWADSSALSRSSVQTKKCRDCIELKTDTLQPTPDSLRVEATLLSTGAVAGILWLALMSG